MDSQLLSLLLRLHPGGHHSCHRFLSGVTTYIPGGVQGHIPPRGCAGACDPVWAPERLPRSGRLAEHKASPQRCAPAGGEAGHEAPFTHPCPQCIGHKVLLSSVCKHRHMAACCHFLVHQFCYSVHVPALLPLLSFHLCVLRSQPLPSSGSESHSTS